MIETRRKSFLIIAGVLFVLEPSVRAGTCFTSDGSCPAAFYKDVISGGCVSCPQGAICLGGTTIPVPAQGYWGDVSDMAVAASTGSVIQIQKCVRETCRGGVNKHSQLAISSECWQPGPTSLACSNDALLCATGSRGPLCQSCEPGYHYQPGSKTCRRCADTQATSGREIGYLITLVFMMFMGLLVAAASIQLLTLPSFVYRFWLVGVFSHVRLAAVKIIVGFFTVLTSMVAAVDAPFPPPFKQFVDLLHQDGIDGFSVRCNFFDALGIKDSPFNMLKTEVFASFVFPIALALFIEAVARVRCCFVVRNTMLDMRVDEFFQRRRREILGQHRSAVGLVIYICVPISAMRQFAALDCISVGGYSLLRSDTLVSCESNEYLEFKNQMLPLLLTTLLVPIFCLVPLVRTRTKLNPSLAEGDDGSLVMYVRARDETIQGLRAFFQDYKPKWFFFDIIDIYRRVVLLGGLQLMEKWFSREAAGALFSFFCLLITAEIKPYARKSSNALSTVAHVMIVLLYSWAFVLINSTDVNASNHVMGFCFLSMSLVVIVLALFLASRSYRTARRVAWKKVTRTQRKIEYACGFSASKIVTTIQAVAKNSVPSAHVLVYYYCSLEAATELLIAGIPAKMMLSRLDGNDTVNSRSKKRPSSRGGIVFTTHLPHELTKLERMSSIFEANREVMLAISIDARLLVPADQEQGNTGGGGRISPENVGGQEVPYLWLLSSTILSAMRPDYFGDVLDPQPWLDGIVMLPPHCIVRAYQLTDATLGRPAISGSVESSNYYPMVAPVYSNAHGESASSEGSKVVIDVPVVVTGKQRGVQRLETIEDFHKEMTEVRGLCSIQGLIPIYHFTSAACAAYILHDGFRMSTQGQGDGGVYFSMFGPAWYDIGSTEYEDKVTIDCFGKERLEEYRGAHKLDVCIVYAADPGILTPAPSRKNAVMVSKGTFTDLSLPHGDDSFFLRPDRIMRAFLIDPWDPPERRSRESSDAAIYVEKTKDTENQKKLQATEATMDANSNAARALHFDRLRSHQISIGDDSLVSFDEESQSPSMSDCTISIVLDAVGLNTPQRPGNVSRQAILFPSFPWSRQATQRGSMLRVSSGVKGVSELFDPQNKGLQMDMAFALRSSIALPRVQSNRKSSVFQLPEQKIEPADMQQKLDISSTEMANPVALRPQAPTLPSSESFGGRESSMSLSFSPIYDGGEDLEMELVNFSSDPAETKDSVKDDPEQRNSSLVEMFGAVNSGDLHVPDEPGASENKESVNDGVDPSDAMKGADASVPDNASIGAACSADLKEPPSPRAQQNTGAGMFDRLTARAAPPGRLSRRIAKKFVSSPNVVKSNMHTL